MVNRVLIRIKVVQLLYSYLITKSDFKLRMTPVKDTRDFRFAHQIYIDLLLLMLELSGNRPLTDATAPRVKLPTNNRLRESELIQTLGANRQMLQLAEQATSGNPFEGVLKHIYDKITESELYRKYLRARNRGAKEDVDFWVKVINDIIRPDESMLLAAREIPNFTNRGYQYGLDSVIASIEAYATECVTFTAARNALTTSLDKAYELYQRLLTLPLRIVRAYEQLNERNSEKYLPTEDDLNPNTTLYSDNLVAQLLADPVVALYLDKHPELYSESPELIDHFLSLILASDEYKQYLALDEHTLQTDARFWRNVITNIILPDNEFAQCLEDKSIYWNDDLEIMSTFVIKTLKRFERPLNQSEDGNSSLPSDPVLPQYKDKEDEAFGPALFIDVTEHYDEYRNLIDEFVNTREWDTNRLAFMDVVIMCTAIAELINFPQIPVPVTMNEYIEIANCYSTPKSGKFINGVLYSVIQKLKSEGRIHK